MPFNPAAPMAKWKVRLEISIFMIYGRCATRMLLVERLSYEHSSTPNGCAENRCEDQAHYLVFAEDWAGPIRSKIQLADAEIQWSAVVPQRAEATVPRPYE